MKICHTPSDVLYSSLRNNVQCTTIPIYCRLDRQSRSWISRFKFDVQPETVFETSNQTYEFLEARPREISHSYISTGIFTNMVKILICTSAPMIGSTNKRMKEFRNRSHLLNRQFDRDKTSLTHLSVRKYQWMKSITNYNLME